MGDFPPPPRRHVKASELLHRAVDKSYEDLRTLLLQLPTLREDERREPLLAHLIAARQRFAQLLAVLKWSVQSPLLQQCESLLVRAETYRNQVNETNDRLFFLHADLDRAKERRYDLSTAIDVLSGGSYLRFPTIVQHAMFPRELPPVDVDTAAREVEDLIRFRLIEAEIPEQFTNLRLEGGFVTCEAEGEFEIVLTLQGKAKDSLWRVISVNTALTDAGALEAHARHASTNALRIIQSSAPGPVHYNHLKNLVQRTMNKSERPFVDAFKVMREFCSALALQILSAQGTLLMDGRWKNRVMVKYHREHNLQHFVNFARRRRSKIRYSGEAAATGSSEGTGGQVVTLSFPEKVNVDPLKIIAIQGHLTNGGGFELSLQLARPPFTYVLPKDPQAHLLAERGHHVNERGQLIFRYPPTALLGDYMNENPLEVFMLELVCVVKPLCELAVKLEKILRPTGRYTNELKDDGHFYVESADPFAIVLACRTKNPRRTIAAGSSPDGMVTYRVTIQFKQKMGFVVNYSHKAEHPLMHFIQSALNGHSDPAQLVEALERTCIPMGILASVVESQLLCAKYYRHDADPAKEGAASGGVKMFGMGKKGGKGMKLGYKTKLPGEETGYYAEKSYGGDDKSFVPAELVLIPRSQTHVRLSYGDRCAVDIYFLENRTVKMQSSSSGVRVPSCPADKGLLMDFQLFGEKLRSTLSEMASV
ncbi:hypothetical protein P43SY_000801 [Pythium insidiosum]|uniref:Mediator of RNA polymerase II transcription subunit 14 n=1 Tax=Pythium insidiosum TaxID=114742 RepID=A0AAD5Q9Q7_PYTIN|nr:hypothetical protein P43SY_000801 [Pythium insidiosum]